MASDLRCFCAYSLLWRHLGWSVAEIDSMPDAVLAAALYFIEPPEPTA